MPACCTPCWNYRPRRALFRASQGGRIIRRVRHRADSLALRPAHCQLLGQPTAVPNLDLMVTIGGRRYGFEVKHSDAPGTTRSMRVAVQDLQLEHLWIVYPGDESLFAGRADRGPAIGAIPGFSMA